MVCCAFKKKSAAPRDPPWVVWPPSPQQLQRLIELYVTRLEALLRCTVDVSRPEETHTAVVCSCLWPRFLPIIWDHYLDLF